MRIHEYLEIADKGGGRKLIQCLKCGYEFCDPRENYKEYALYRERSLSDFTSRRLRSGEEPFIVYQEYICPGCGVLLEVDPYCEELDKDNKIVWDIQVEV